MTKYLVLLGCLLLATPARAQDESSVNPNYPATDADVDSYGLRENFLATYNDINYLLAHGAFPSLDANQLAGALVTGAAIGIDIPSCGSASNGLGWVSGVGFICNSFPGGGSGTVTSVGFVGDGMVFSSAPSTPVTGAGNIGPTLLGHAANTFFAGPTGGGDTTPNFRFIAGEDLPDPTTGSLGGVQAFSALTHQFMRGISNFGVPQAAQPACGDLSDGGTACAAALGTSGTTVPLNNGNNTFSGTDNFTGTFQVGGQSLAPSATTDTTNASNITTGTLSNNRLASVLANQLLGSLGGGSPSGVPVPACLSLNNALTWTPGVGFGCNTFAGSSPVSITAGSSFFVVTPTPLTGTGTADVAKFIKAATASVALTNFGGI